MGMEYYAVCREAKKYASLGRFYEWDGTDRRTWVGDNKGEGETDQVHVGYYWMWRFVQFQHEFNGKLIEVMNDDHLYNLKYEPDSDWASWTKFEIEEA